MSKSQKQQPESQDIVCAFCKQPGESLKLCAACGSVSYCSAACQGTHWADHKPACKLIKEKKAQVKAGIITAINMPSPQPLRNPQDWDWDVYRAAFAGRHKDVQSMLELRALDINWRESKSGATAAFAAAQEGQHQCLSVLIKHGSREYLLKADISG
jgi:hypothetical protein